ncbi:hydroxymethylpyrimidine/phosphomethylpyrimidine kinase [Rothia sp. P7208]|uniref:hydroxymethylpyrimidine/phosphomethylpyrimidine kinase n=1 Tax=Rothia sp. P7208 TaxID=3402660 RepID=UPI003AD496E3
MTKRPYALTIAGNEATGGAGAQADLKTFQALGVYGSLALTCIVSFDPKNDWAHRFVPVDAQTVHDQLEVVHATYNLDAVKIGMLGTVPTIETVARFLEEHTPKNLVLDPVLICKGQEPGAALDIDNALKEKILPLATFVTPNHFESMSLSGMDSITTVKELEQAARIIHEKSGATVLAKGSIRLEGDNAVDVYYDGNTLEVLETPKIDDGAVVAGAGCTLATAITGYLAQGKTPLEAAQQAKKFVSAGIAERVRSNAPFDALYQINQ